MLVSSNLELVLVSAGQDGGQTKPCCSTAKQHSQNILVKSSKQNVLSVILLI